jgi:hypothetical protein
MIIIIIIIIHIICPLFSIHQYQQGFDFKSKIGMILFEVHAFHPQSDLSLVNCCYGPRDMNWLYRMLIGQVSGLPV